MADNEFDRVHQITEKAYNLKKEDKLEEARSLLQSGLEDYPDNNYLKSSLAELHLRQNRFEDALNLAR